jgi:hypothetical protein
MKMTTIEKNRSNEALKAMALALFPSLQWRHHGIGVLQGYVVEDVDVEVRIHVWDRSLLKPGMDVSGDIHDHRFDLVSHVLCGAVGHEEIIPEEVDDGAWAMLKLTHARAAKESAYHGPTAPLPGRFHALRTAYVIESGYTYRFPSGRFHRSPVLEGTAVTCVEKHNQSNASARILHPIDVPPVMAFGHDMDWSLIGPVMQRARAALEENPCK